MEKPMKNNKLQSKTSRSILIFLALISGFLGSSSWIGEKFVFAQSAAAAKPGAAKYKVFCGHESHGNNGYRTIICYTNYKDAADVAMAHNRFNRGHSAEVISCE
jgi:hypothetical protein